MRQLGPPRDVTMAAGPIGVRFVHDCDSDGQGQSQGQGGGAITHTALCFRGGQICEFMLKKGYVDRDSEAVATTTVVEGAHAVMIPQLAGGRQGASI